MPGGGPGGILGIGGLGGPPIGGIPPLPPPGAITCGEGPPTPRTGPCNPEEKLWLLTMLQKETSLKNTQKPVLEQFEINEVD